MSSENDLPALDALGEELALAASRLEPAPASVRRRFRRRVVVGVVLGALALAGGATAANLISVGEPDRDPSAIPPAQRPAEPITGQPIAATAPDAGAGGKWGAVAYTNQSGAPCALAGWLRGRQLGVVRGGEFHPYESLRSGVCGSARSGSISVSTISTTEPAQRTLVFGRAMGEGVTAVTVSDGTRNHRAPTAEGGTYLLVLDGRVSPSQIQVHPA